MGGGILEQRLGVNLRSLESSIFVLNVLIGRGGGVLRERTMISSILILVFVAGSVLGFSPNDIVSIGDRYENAATNWDESALYGLTNEIGRLLETRPSSPAPLLVLQGKCFWRLQIIAFTQNNKKDQVALGEKALAALEKAEQLEAEVVDILPTKGLVYQLMAGTGLKNGAVYGPKSAEVADAIRKISPDNYYADFLTSVNLLQMPGFVGGNPTKARRNFEQMLPKYPDSLDLRVQYAKSLAKTGAGDSARVVLTQVLQKNPRHLLARHWLSEL